MKPRIGRNSAFECRPDSRLVECSNGLLRSRVAYSLLELQVVLALVVLFAMSTGLTLQRPLVQGRMRAAIAQFSNIDGRARRLATASGSSTLIVVDRDAVELRDAANATVCRHRWPAGCYVQRARVCSLVDWPEFVIRTTSHESRANPEDVRFGLRISPDGRSDDYVVTIGCGRVQRSIQVVGATGQIIERNAQRLSRARTR